MAEIIFTLAKLRFSAVFFFFVRFVKIISGQENTFLWCAVFAYVWFIKYSRAFLKLRLVGSHLNMICLLENGLLIWPVVFPLDSKIESSSVRFANEFKYLFLFSWRARLLDTFASFCWQATTEAAKEIHCLTSNTMMMMAHWVAKRQQPNSCSSEVGFVYSVSIYMLYIHLFLGYRNVKRVRKVISSRLLTPNMAKWVVFWPTVYLFAGHC